MKSAKRSGLYREREDKCVLFHWESWVSAGWSKLPAANIWTPVTVPWLC